MNPMQFKKVKETHAVEVCKRVDLDDQASAILNAEQSPPEFLQLLIDHGLYPDAVRFLSQALPNREATWWACLCARDVLREDSPPDILAAVESAEKWVYKPTEENRGITFGLAEKATFNTPASWAAVAAFWSGGNISPYAEAIVNPSPDLNGKAVAGAVMLAAVQGEASDIEARYQKYLRQGIDIACGGNGRNPDKENLRTDEK
ncbi:MAG: DUF6931 family protein [Gammaproteobacteria bacterium]